MLAGSEGRLEHAHALASLGATLLAAGHRVAAREPLREALDLAHRCGAAPVQQRVRDDLVAAGARLRHAYAKLGVENRLLLADCFANLQA